MAAHPSIGDMIKHPYGVVENYVDPDGQVFEGIYAHAVKNSVPNFEYHQSNLLFGFLLAAAQSEQKKEIQYINMMKNSFDSILQQSVLYKEFLKLYDSIMSKGGGISMDLSILVDTIQKMKLGLYELDKGLKENLETFKDINTAFLDKNMIEEFRNALHYTGAGSSKKIVGKINPDMTGQDILDEILTNIETKMRQALANSKIDKNSKEGQALIRRYEQAIDNILILYRTKLEQFYTTKFTVIDDATKILQMKIKDLESAAQSYDQKQTSKKAKILTNSDGDPRTLQQVIINTFTGNWGGKSVEYTLDILRGGINTGNIGGASGKSIDADNIQLVNTKGEFYFGTYRQDKNLNNTGTTWSDISDFDVFMEQIEKIENFESKFMIMYSAKDQSVGADFKKNLVATTDVKIKGSGSLETRGPEIINMYNHLKNPGAMDPTDLVFSIANLGEDFVCHGQAEQAKQTLGAICVGWMFDDVEQIVKGNSLIKGTSIIHLYNINNYYYTLSDILYKTAASLDSVSLSQNNYVKIGITSIPKGGIYENMVAKNSPEEGMPRWDKIAETILKTNIDIHMNPKSLFNTLFSGVFGKI